MNQHPQYKVYTYTIAAGGSAEVSGLAEFFTCLDASKVFKITFGDAPQTDFAKGLTYDAQVPFNFVRIENPNDSEITVQFAVGKGGIKDARLILSGAVDVSTISAELVGTIEPITIGAGLSVRLLLPDSSRKETILRNLSDVGEVWVRGDAIAAQGGYLVQSKEAIVLTTSAGLWAYNPTAANVSVSGLTIEGAV